MYIKCKHCQTNPCDIKLWHIKTQNNSKRVTMETHLYCWKCFNYLSGLTEKDFSEWEDSLKNFIECHNCKKDILIEYYYFTNILAATFCIWCPECFAKLFSDLYQKYGGK